MEEWLRLVTRDAVVVIDAMALVVIVIGTVEAFFTGLWAAFPAPAHRQPRDLLHQEFKVGLDRSEIDVLGITSWLD